MWPTDAGRWNSFDDPQRLARRDAYRYNNFRLVKNVAWVIAFTHEHSLSVNGGTDKIQYYLS